MYLQTDILPKVYTASKKDLDHVAKQVKYNESTWKWMT